MDNFDYPAIGQRIKQLRKRKGLNQTELAQMLKKTLSAPYRSTKLERLKCRLQLSNQIADLLDTASTYILGYESSTTQIRTLADVMDFLFKHGNGRGHRLQGQCAEAAPQQAMGMFHFL